MYIYKSIGIKIKVASHEDRGKDDSLSPSKTSIGSRQDSGDSVKAVSGWEDPAFPS